MFAILTIAYTIVSIMSTGYEAVGMGVVAGLFGIATAISCINNDKK